MRKLLASALALASLLCAPLARAATTVTTSDGSTFTLPSVVNLSTTAPGGYMPLIGVVCFAGCSASGSSGTATQGPAAGGTAPSYANAIGAIYNATPPSFTDGQFGGLRIDSDGSLYTNLRDPLPAGSNTIGAVKAATVTPTVTAATVGTSSAQAVASATWTYVAIDNESASASIACSFGGIAALNSAGSWTVPPGQTRTWAPGAAPSGAINCIASAVSTPVTIASY
jgi:hypothetical protein